MGFKIYTNQCTMFRELLQMYLDYFQNNGEPSLKIICNCDVPSKIILNAYKKLPPIEDMNEREKKEMKRYVIDMFPEKSPEEKVKCCKIIYTIGTML